LAPNYGETASCTDLETLKYGKISYAKSNLNLSLRSSSSSTLLDRVAPFVALGPVVESLARLPSEVSNRDLFREALGGDESWLVGELLNPAGDDVVDGVEADVVCEVEGTHWVPRSELRQWKSEEWGG